MNPVSPISFANISIAAPLLFEDSFHIPNFAEEYLHVDNSTVFNTLSDTTLWTAPSDSFMRYRGRELKRQKAFWTELYDPLHKYSYPGFQYKSMLSYRPFAYTPTIESFVDQMQRNLRVNDQLVVIHALQRFGRQYRLSQ